MRKYLLLGFALCALAACETIGGIGRDISRGAEAVDRVI